MADSPLYLGIDLGTTNSTAAIYDGERLEVVRNAQGSPLTPSVVRIDPRGVVTVGARARKTLESDPVGTRAEFKRLMGTSTPIEFPAAKQRRMPEELAAEVLKALRTDVQAQTGVLPETATISVPALFELPQSRATSDAARLAGFERVELIQEPIASALAAGWSADLGEGRWLVYDMGGGTFDVSLLETRDGFLRVVDHDGDNYLGGRDIDWAIVDWVLSELEAAGGVSIARSDPTASVALRKLKVAAEEAKIEAARGAEASIFVPGLLDGVDVDLVLDPARLERLCLPLVDRSIEVCRRLLERHAVDSTSLSRVVLVGGPTTMPSLRALVQAALGAPFAKAIDPMTVVAQGAALFAATAGLDARPRTKSRAAAGRTLVLRFPPVAPDLETHVVGRVADLAASPLLDTLRLVPSGGGEPSVGSIEPDGTFAIEV
jgi:molecular chaperone DnaK